MFHSWVDYRSKSNWSAWAERPFCLFSMASFRMLPLRSVFARTLALALLGVVVSLLSIEMVVPGALAEAVAVVGAIAVSNLLSE